jgi:hypothetical protein
MGILIMKLSSIMLAAFVLSAAFSPAIAATIARKLDCAALLPNLATCNTQTPDATRIACQQNICGSYGECLAGTEPIAPIPQLSTLCSGLGTPLPTSTSAPTPIQPTPVR